jgi:hypothetical protein
MTTAAKCPRGLRAPGKRLWRAISGDLLLDERELALLEMAARQADDIAALEAEVRRDGVTATGSMGQPRVSGALAELRQARLAVARLLGQIDLPNDETASDASRRGQSAAQKRWASDTRRKVREARGA